MIGCVIVAHAPLGGALLQCASHVFGKAPLSCRVIDVIADAEPALLVAAAIDAIADVDDGHGVLVMVDVFGATPGNVATQLAKSGRVEVIAGVNLPMLLRILCYRDTVGLHELAEKAMIGGKAGITTVAVTPRPEQQQRFPHDPNDDSDDGHSRLQDQQ